MREGGLSCCFCFERLVRLFVMLIVNRSVIRQRTPLTRDRSLSGTDSSAPRSSVTLSSCSSSSTGISSPEKLRLISPGVCHLSFPVRLLLSSLPVALSVLSCLLKVFWVSLIPVNVDRERERDLSENGVDVMAAIALDAYGDGVFLAEEDGKGGKGESTVVDDPSADDRLVWVSVEDEGGPTAFMSG